MDYNCIITIDEGVDGQGKRRYGYIKCFIAYRGETTMEDAIDKFDTIIVQGIDKDSSDCVLLDIQELGSLENDLPLYILKNLVVSVRKLTTNV